ncbi:alginate lyase family protein, partial [Klebsiella pneumoniae]|uniref:alginate lyase family protein n=1 Tax=Klebsiella pneumoniae TaxID=573 RepID=UPI0038549CFC
DGVHLLQASKSWNKKDDAALKNWFSSFLNWMQSSKIGVDELNAKNNHGVWLDAQQLSIALYIDSTDLANKIVLRSADRLDKQMNGEGFFPLELERK